MNQLESLPGAGAGATFLEAWGQGGAWISVCSQGSIKQEIKRNGGGEKDCWVGTLEGLIGFSNLAKEPLERFFFF